MSSFESKFEKAVDDGVFPGAILLAKNKTGNRGELNYAKVFGKKTLGSDEPLQLNSVLSLASMTKLIGSIAAMQIVEKGLITLDTDVSDIIPELGNQPIFQGFDESNNPILVTRKNPLKFKYLLTHSSGCVYDMLNPSMTAYLNHVGQPPHKATLETKYGYPLAFEPGTGWEYGTGIDWAGRVVERLTGQTLQSYMQTHIFDPLGITRIAFSPYLTSTMRADLAGMTIRGPDGKVVPYTRPYITDGDTDCFAGHGGYADLTDYFKIVESLLFDDGKLLGRETTKVMFSPQLTAESKAAHAKITGNEEFAKMFIGEFPTDYVTYDWGIGGVMLDGDDGSTKRKAGTMIWSGLPNLFWFVDRKAGVCGVFGTQVIPPGDDKVGEMLALFEKEMYDKAGVQAKL